MANENPVVVPLDAETRAAIDEWVAYCRELGRVGGVPIGDGVPNPLALERLWDQ